MVKKTKKNGAFTLVELIVATAISLMALAMISETTGMLKSSATATTQHGDSTQQCKLAMDKILAEARLADRSLTQFPVHGTATFVSNETGTLILRKPKFDSNGVPEAGKFDVSVFTVENAPAGRPGPRVIRRYVGSIDGTTDTLANAGTIIASGVTNMNICYSTCETFYGNRSRKNFDLVTTPAGSNSMYTQQVLVARIDRLTDGTASLVGNRVIFPLAPNSTVPIDVRYRVFPTVNANPEKGNFASEILLSIGLNNTRKDRSFTNHTDQYLVRGGAILGNE